MTITLASNYVMANRCLCRIELLIKVIYNYLVLHWMSLPVEDERIPFVPNAPGANHNNFHEEGLTKRLPGDQKLFMDICIFIPGNSKSKPS